MKQATPGADPIGAIRPAPELGDCVEAYWISWNNPSCTTRLLPDGRIDVVLELGGGGGTCAIHGSVTAPTLRSVKPGSSYVGIRFRPGMARHFMVPDAACTQDAVLSDPRLLRFSTDRALQAASPQAVVAALQHELIRLKRAHVPPKARVDRMIDGVMAVHGATTVQQLAAACAISTRQVERDFQHAVGMSPKAFMAIQRCLFARTLLRQGVAASHAAVDAGYFDQSHLHRDMLRWAGQTPAATARADVAFLQDRTLRLTNHGASSTPKGALP